MTCCEGWTSCNGFTLLVLLLFGVVLNAIPLVVNLVEDDKFSENPISCFEWWFPGIIGAGLLVIPATAMSLSARKRACCNNRTGMFLSSLTSILTVIGGVYCMMVSIQALFEGPLICNPEGMRTLSCQFSFKNLSAIHTESFNLQWFLNDTCVASAPNNGTNGNWITSGLHFNSKENAHRTIHVSVFLGLLLVGILEVLCALCQIVAGFFGCLCGVSRRRERVV
ncbi:PREDICTED: transmembrane 4 L6 family member 20 [Elephantulus edwardii]|uniref:transmembrane 4 L6 family member 20 n=1 Tax=Elephantulus edwardii TaxID=28737 RepID=UPI0003F0859A|nr:PREDICTED: transmembrane 4 L6 family member 20 [Elephantulus edwardii]